MEGPDFLKQKYNLHNAPEVEKAAERTEIRTGEKVPQNPTEQIQNYLDRFKEIIDRTDEDKRERGMEALKHVLHNKFVITPEEIPEGYYENQRRLAREQGHGDIDIGEEIRQQLAEVVVTDQKTSLDNWVDYLSSSDATYPDYLKYWAFRSILGMGSFDKEKHEFSKRSKGTTKPFPDLNREALAYVLDEIHHKHGGIQSVVPPNIETPDEETKKFEQILKSENFAKLYAWAIEKVTPASEEAITNTQGEWVKYDQHSDHMPLVESLQGHGTGWCTAGESTAEAQLANGDFYVYYSLDKDGKPTVPRAAIRMQENGIAEVRGIAAEQNLDPYIAPIVEAKMKEFPDGAQYEKKSKDMKILTSIENKNKKKEALNKDDLVFLYEIHTPIEGFGYQKDPRIEEIRSERNPIDDVPIVFECTREEIAHVPEEVTEKTKAYIGKLFPDIFKKNIEHIFTSFPEGKIQEYHVEIGGKTKEQYETELKEKNVYVTEYAQSLIDSPDFITSKTIEGTDLVKLTVGDLGFSNGATTDEIYTKAEEYGLELCPAEVGPELRLAYSGSEWMLIGMKQITDRDGFPGVFGLDRGGDGLRLDAAVLSRRSGGVLALASFSVSAIHLEILKLNSF